MTSFQQLTLFLAFLMAMNISVFAQYSYYSSNSSVGDCNTDNLGYKCSDATNSCNTYAYMRVQTLDYTPTYIGSNLNFSTASAIGKASGLSSDNAEVYVGEGLYIPFTCSCNGNTSIYNIVYTIVPADTFWKLSTQTFEGLTTCTAVLAANPTAIATDLQVGEMVNLPIRCACPTKDQAARGYKYLVTYPVNAGDNITSVVARFGLNLDEFLSTNSINASSELFYPTTVLLPFLNVPTNPPNATTATSVSVSPPPPSSSGGSKTGMYVGIAIAAAVVVLIAGIIAFCFVKKKKSKYKQPGEQPPVLPVIGTPEKPAAKAQTQVDKDLHDAMYEFAGVEKLTTYSLYDLKHATQDFSESNQIKGEVYHGVIKGKHVAVKKMTRNISHELEILQKVHHANLVALLGYCNSSPEQAYLVCEYAENGSLSDWLHPEDYRDVSTGSQSSSHLSWMSRIQIAVDVATALEYIHEHTTPSYVHKDIKSSNILLDSKLRGKVANFALAKSTTNAEEVTRHIQGTQGYLAPEYLSLGVVSPKIDMYAFGVVLLEMLSGREAITRDETGRECNLSELIGPLIGHDGDAKGKERLKGWMDPRLQSAYPLDCAYSVAMLARSCVADDPNARLGAREVAYTLARVLEISSDWEPASHAESFNDNTVEAR